MPKHTWPEHRASEPLVVVATRWNQAGLERHARLMELQHRDNGFAAKFGRCSRQIVDPAPFDDARTCVVGVRES